jgi:hypothetical protein
MFIIPVKFDPERPVIYECIKRIKTYHPFDKIVIVDSASEDKSYFENIPPDVEIMDVNNTSYGVNAYHRAWYSYRHEDFYYCIYDSLFLNRSLKPFERFPLTTIRHFDTPPTGVGWDEKGEDLSIWITQQMHKHMRLCDAQVMHDLDAVGLFDILPENKYQLCAMERIVGIAMQAQGYDPSNSIQGEMFGFFDEYNETYVQKVHMARS